MEERQQGSETENVVDEIQELKNDLADMQELVNENNAIVKKIHNHLRWSFWIRIVWYAILIGLPFVIYFYVLEPYFEALGANYQTFSAGIKEIPGWKQVHELIDKSFGGGNN